MYSSEYKHVDVISSSTKYPTYNVWRNITFAALMTLSILSCEKKIPVSTFACVELSKDEIDAMEMQYTFVSHYGVGDGFHGRETASGAIMDYRKPAAARKCSISNRKLPYGSIVRFYNLDDASCFVDVEINDCGTLTRNRGFDLAHDAFAHIYDPDLGKARVGYKIIFKPK